MSKLAAALLAVVLAPCIVERLDAQVTIVRTLPPSSAPEAHAQWGAPAPEPAAALAAGRMQLSGRLSLGGSAGSDAAGDPTYGLITDSRLRLVQPLGAATTLQIDGTAVRKHSLDGVRQAYSSEIGLTAERFSLNAGGTFTRDETFTEGTAAASMGAAIKASASTTLMPSLPLTLSYLHNGKQAEGQTEVGLPVQSDSLTLSSVGSIGPVGLEVAGALNRVADTGLRLETLGTNGKLQATVPVLRTLSILARLTPSASRTEYAATGGIVSSTSIESGLGLLFPLLETLQIALIAGRIDTWSASEGIPGALPPHQVTWSGQLGAEARNLLGVSASPRWKIAKTVGGNLVNTVSLAGEWAAEREGFLKEARAGSELSFVNEDGGGFLESRDTWNAAVTMTPLEKMSMTASYSGSFDGGPGAASGASWSHKANARLSHEAGPLLDYKASAALESRYAEGVSTTTQQYAAGVDVKPCWGERQMLFTLSENVAIGTVALSKASFSASVPLVPSVITRYAFDWEWIDRATAGGGPGHAFRDLIGIAVSGARFPLSFSAEYALSHGYRGLRHDVEASLQFPFSGGLLLEGSLAISSFREDGASRLPFLFSLGFARRF